MLEANTKYRNLVGDAEERSRKIIFEAESRAAVAKQSYEEQVKKQRRIAACTPAFIRNST